MLDVPCRQRTSNREPVHAPTQTTPCSHTLQATNAPSTLAQATRGLTRGALRQRPPRSQHTIHSITFTPWHTLFTAYHSCPVHAPQTTRGRTRGALRRPPTCSACHSHHAIHSISFMPMAHPVNTLFTSCLLPTFYRPRACDLVGRAAVGRFGHRPPLARAGGAAAQQRGASTLPTPPVHTLAHTPPAQSACAHPPVPLRSVLHSHPIHTRSHPRAPFSCPPAPRDLAVGST